MVQVSASYDAVIIGSGHNGLTAACCLAAAGQRVLVLERQAEFGGATTSQRVFPDHDAWLSRYSYLVSLYPQRLQQLLQLDFQTLRRRTASFTPWTDASGGARALVISNASPDRTRASLEELGGREAVRGWQEFGELQSALAALVWPSFTQPLQPRRAFTEQLTTPLLRRAWNAFVERPLGEVIEQVFADDVLRGVVMTDGKIGVFTEPHDATLLQNRCFLYHVIGNGCGEWRVPAGGMRSLVNALLKRCHELGVTLLANAAALHIEPGNHLQSVTFSDPVNGSQRRVLGRSVLINAGPRTQAALLGKTWQPKPGDEGSVVKINLLLERLPKVRAAGFTAEEAFGGTLHIDEGYEQMLHSWSTAVAGNIPETPPGEVYCHTLTDRSILSPQLQAAGWHTLTLFGLDMPWRLFANRDPAMHAERRQLVLQKYLAGLNRICDEPVEACLARASDGSPCVEIKSPADLERELDLDLGNIFHNQLSWFFGSDEADSDGPGTAPGQWGVETDSPGIFRCGSSAHRGGAVSGIPGYNAARCILGPNMPGAI
ncbi:MAG: phytoene desaturase family protein [Planctomycetota bacterium]